MEKILCFGDSNTYGHDPRSWIGERYPNGVYWTSRISYGERTVKNEGQNGREIPHLPGALRSAKALFESFDSTLITVMLGTNDMLMNPLEAAEFTAERMRLFLDLILKEGFDASRILLIAPPPMTRGAWVESDNLVNESHRLVGLYKSLSEQTGVLFADTSSWDIKLCFDGVHFSKEGHLTFADKLDKLLCEKGL